MIVGSVVKHEGQLDTVLEIEGYRIRLRRAGWIDGRMMVTVTEPPRPVLEDCMTPLEKEIYGGMYKLRYGKSGDA